jgi:hypothetical protein
MRRIINTFFIAIISIAINSTAQDTTIFEKGKFTIGIGYNIPLGKNISVTKYFNPNIQIGYQIPIITEENKSVILSVNIGATHYSLITTKITDPYYKYEINLHSKLTYTSINISLLQNYFQVMDLFHWGLSYQHLLYANTFQTLSYDKAEPSIAPYYAILYRQTDKNSLTQYNKNVLYLEFLKDINYNKHLDLFLNFKLQLTNIINRQYSYIAPYRTAQLSIGIKF